jgi:hypothetical protein
VGYPPADGELEGATTVSEPEPAPEPEEDHSGVQLDALSGMAERRSQPLAAEPTPSTAADEVPVEGVDEAPVEADVVHDEPTEDSGASAPTRDAVVSEPDELDPLTAPIEALSDDASIAHVPKDEPTPIADEVAAAVPVIESTSAEESDESMDEAPVVGEARPESRAPKLARMAQLLIVAAAMFNLLVAAVNAVAGSPVDASLTPVVLAVSLLTLAIWAGSAVVFLHWLARAYAYAVSTSAVRQRHGANMALAGWFIPIVGLLIGYRVLQDVWGGSDPATRDDAEAATPKARSIDVWLLGIATSMIFGYVIPLALGDSALWGGLAAFGVVVAGLALASTVGTISDWQSSSAPTAEPTEVADEGTVSTRVDELQPVELADESAEAEPSMAASD